MNSHKQYPVPDTIPEIMQEHVCRVGSLEACPHIDWSTVAFGRVCAKNKPRNFPVAISAKGNQDVICRGMFDQVRTVLDIEDSVAKEAVA